MTIGFDRPDWQAHAACKGCDPELFFSTRGDTTPVEEARAVCVECPVRWSCANYALDNWEKHGMWGGLSERQRRPIRSNRKKRNEVRAKAYIEAVNLGLYPPSLPVEIDGQVPCEGCGTMFVPTNRLHRFCQYRCSERIREGRRDRHWGAA